ncbi:hypothetical protein PENTCL1PPCAC_7861, partial [Pristionchus entomophagus]
IDEPSFMHQKASKIILQYERQINPNLILRLGEGIRRSSCPRHPLAIAFSDTVVAPSSGRVTSCALTTFQKRPKIPVAPFAFVSSGAEICLCAALMKSGCLRSDE